MSETEELMNSKRFSDEFKIEAIKQVVDRDHAVAELAWRLDVSSHRLTHG